MTALTEERLREPIGDHAILDVVSHPMKAASKVLLGSLVVLNAGYLAKGTAATGLIAVGMAEQTIDNTVGTAGNGDLVCRVRQGVTGPYANSASSDAIAQTEVGKDCYIVDDNTVAKTDGSSSRSRAGKVAKVTADGVWVLMGIGL